MAVVSCSLRTESRPEKSTQQRKQNFRWPFAVRLDDVFYTHDLGIVMSIVETALLVYQMVAYVSVVTLTAYHTT